MEARAPVRALVRAGLGLEAAELVERRSYVVLHQHSTRAEWGGSTAGRWYNQHTWASPRLPILASARAECTTAGQVECIGNGTDLRVLLHCMSAAAAGPGKHAMTIDCTYSGIAAATYQHGRSALAA